MQAEDQRKADRRTEAGHDRGVEARECRDDASSPLPDWDLEAKFRCASLGVNVNKPRIPGQHMASMTAELWRLPALTTVPTYGQEVQASTQ